MSDKASAARIVQVECCFKCGICSAVCACNAISEKPAGIAIDGSACSRCMACVRLCPAGLIGDREVG